MSLSCAAQHVCLCYIPSKQCFEEMRFFKEVQFSLHSIHFNQKSCCHLQAGGCFWACQMFVFFRKIFFFEGWIFSRKCLIYNVYCVLKRNIPLFFLYHGNIPSGRCCFLQRLNTWLKVAIIFKQFSLSNRNWQYCVKTCCVL